MIQTLPGRRFPWNGSSPRLLRGPLVANPDARRPRAVDLLALSEDTLCPLHYADL
jgi:hypothetical protein